MTTLPAKLDAIPAVDIDSGRFKYVLIRVDMQGDTEAKQEHSKVIVRGYKWAAFHADIYDKVQEELETAGFDTECLGGGRIMHESDKRTIQVYGYSQGFGLADHAVTTELLKARYPGYESITWTNEVPHVFEIRNNGRHYRDLHLVVRRNPAGNRIIVLPNRGWTTCRLLPPTTLGKATDGRAYVYRTSASTQGDGTWIFSQQSIDSAGSLPGQTLEPIYNFPEHVVSEDNDGDERLLLMYNDEFPNGTSSEIAAHAKGVVAFDGQSGFWLVHSVPRFPPAPGGDRSPETRTNYSYPASGLRYGQTMLCVSLPFNQADVIGEQLQYYHPFIYHWSVSSSSKEWIQMVPNLVDVARGHHVTKPPWSRSVQLLSSDQLSIISFAKARQFGLDLYGDWMTDALKSSLYVETWTNGQGHPMPSLCINRTLTVENVKQVHLIDGQGFPSHSDHSKWAISSRREDPWVCVADINRMDSQRHRGGGSLCFRHAKLWRGFDRAVSQLEACPLSFDQTIINRKLRKFKKINMKKQIQLRNDVG